MNLKFDRNVHGSDDTKGIGIIISTLKTDLCFKNNENDIQFKTNDNEPKGITSTADETH